MGKITLTTQNVQASLDLHPSNALANCLLPAILAAIPTFLQSLRDCLSETPPAADYQPGNRPRCQVPPNKST